MSFIQQTYQCRKCDYVFNVALGTFGLGFPEECPGCHTKEEGWAEFVSDGWHAKEADNI